LGFARGQGIEPEDIFIKELNGVEYLFALKKEKGKHTSEILPQLLPKLITSLTFPKSMRWGEFDLRFVRPIRWLVALFGQEIVDFEITNIKTDRYTYGHRFLVKEPLSINEPKDYLETLKKGFVIAEQTERRALIWQQILDLAKAEGGQVEQDEELLEEVTYLVEYPTALSGKFVAEYLELPKEVLITPMREHQRYFPVFNKEGKLLNKFITVRNGNKEHLDVVSKGNEKVLEARLADARFFYQEDIKNSLEQLLPKLEQITFQEELGTIMAKVKRIIDITDYLAKEIGVSEVEQEQALRVAKLAKADLVTNMVYEFPELQGIMGAYYARVHGEPEAICTGIREHYLPKFAGDQLPTEVPGWLVSMADKLDTIVGCFAVGIRPTGSQDPYALRRQALAICNMLLDREVQVTIEELLSAAYDRLAQDISPKMVKQELVAEVTEFFFQRMKNILGEEGHRYDVIDAVLATKKSNVTDIANWAKALTDSRNNPEFASLLIGFNRASNIVKKNPGGQVQGEAFTEPAEIELFKAFNQVKEQVGQQVADKQFAEALVSLSKLQQPIDRFFNDIMVMVEDEQVKNNRLALLNSITDFVKEQVDLTKIVVD
ncbi:MAG: glycine--tRNA ligase subunit beta, partial [Bacillota bacterium]|nr:glycine--tRNA ligase subunit beta [Bacillota bacterium]